MSKRNRSQTLVYPLNEYNPDMPWAANEGIGFVNNFTPISGVYYPGPAIKKFVSLREGTGPYTQIDGAILGANIQEGYMSVAVEGGVSAYNVFISNLRDNLSAITFYNSTPAAGWTVGGPPTATVEGWGIQFEGYGNKSFMTNGYDALKVIDRKSVV